MNGVQSASRGLTPAAAPEIRWDFFDRGRPVTVTRAPGRLDVMGGIADYSGALVLEMPIAAATWVAAQPSDEPAVVIESDDIEGLGGESTVTLPLAEIVPARPLTYERAHALLTGDPRRLISISHTARECWERRFALERYHQEMLRAIESAAGVGVPVGLGR